MASQRKWLAGGIGFLAVATAVVPIPSFFFAVEQRAENLLPERGLSWLWSDQGGLTWTTCVILGTLAAISSPWLCRLSLRLAPPQKQRRRIISLVGLGLYLVVASVMAVLILMALIAYPISGDDIRAGEVLLACITAMPILSFGAAAWFFLVIRRARPQPTPNAAALAL